MPPSRLSQQSEGVAWPRPKTWGSPGDRAARKGLRMYRSTWFAVNALVAATTQNPSNPLNGGHIDS